MKAREPRYISQSRKMCTPDARVDALWESRGGGGTNTESGVSVARELMKDEVGIRKAGVSVRRRTGM